MASKPGRARIFVGVDTDFKEKPDGGTGLEFSQSLLTSAATKAGEDEDVDDDEEDWKQPVSGAQNQGHPVAKIGGKKGCKRKWL